MEETGVNMPLILALWSLCFILSVGLVGVGWFCVAGGS
jgi:hypothetical protein